MDVENDLPDLEPLVDRTRTPSADTNTEICKTPSPQLSLKNAKNAVNQEGADEKQKSKGMGSRLASGVRRARSLKLPFRDRATIAVNNKKLSAVADR